MKQFKRALKQLFHSVLAAILIFASILVPLYVDIKKGPNCIGLLIFVFMLAQVITPERVEQKGRGTLLFVRSLIHFALTVAWCVLAIFMASVTEFELGDVLVVVFGSTVPLLFIIAGVCWLVESTQPRHTVTVQRGRRRTESPLTFLYVPNATTEDDEPRLYDPNSNESQDDWGIYRSQVEVDREREAFERYMNRDIEIPKEEYDPSYVFDMRNPYRLPLRKDSKFRPLFERNGGTANG